MAGNVIGVSYDSPNWYSQKANQLGSTIASVRARWAENRERERAREVAEIERFFQAASGMPQLASTWGEEIKTKYGDRHPGVAEMVDEIRNRYEIVAGAKTAWTDQWSALQSGHEARGQEIAAMPAQMPPVVPGGGGPGMPFAIPNMGRPAAAAEHAKVQPDYFPRQALQMLPPAQQLEVNRLIKEQQFDVPDAMRVFDVNRDAPAEIKTLAAAESGLLGPWEGPVAQASRIGVGLEQKPSTLQQQGYWTSERAAREEAQAEILDKTAAKNREAAEHRHGLQVSRMKLQDSLARSRETNRFSHEIGLIDHRKSAPGDGDGKAPRISAELLVRDSRSAVKDFDDGLKAATKGLTGRQIVAAKAAYLRQYGGRRPMALNHGQARILAGEINARVERGELDPEEAEQAAIRASADAMVRMSKGEGPVQAVKNGVAAALAFQAPAPAAASVPVEAEPVLEPISEADEEEIIEAPAPDLGADPVDIRVEAEEEIRRIHPEWTDAQVEDAVGAFLSREAGR